MKKSTLGLFVLLLVIFSYGIIVGHYKVFPFDELKNIKNFFIEEPSQDLDAYPLAFETNVKSLIHIKSIDDIVQTKNFLIEYIWKNEGFPYEKVPNEIEIDIHDSRYNQIKNLKRIDKFTITMDYGINSVAYLFFAEDTNNQLVIYHEGHTGDFYLGKDTIEFFLDKGYSVLALTMPLVGMNNQPIVNDPNFGKIKLQTHGDFELLESENFSPIKFFVEPVTVALNYLDRDFDFDSYYMTGLSGGGWTTVLYSAIDDRISQSYSVAGSVPFYLRTNPMNYGDYEQRIPELYRIANYLDLYIMDSFGNDRKAIQIFNKYDSCCFSNVPYETYENEVKSILTILGNGSFEIHSDDSHKEHVISMNTLNLIYNSMTEN